VGEVVFAAGSLSVSTFKRIEMIAQMAQLISEGFEAPGTGRMVAVAVVEGVSERADRDLREIAEIVGSFSQAHAFSWALRPNGIICAV
jgi:hypothetical protein